MTTESPLYTMRIECPVCRSENEFLAIKVASFTESGSDSDFGPTGQTWRNPEFQNTDPLYYSVATCSSCFYTRELDGNYKNWAKDKRFTPYRQKPLREAHLNHAIRKSHELIHEYQDDPQRSGYLRKLVEMSVEQGKMNRDE